MDDPEAFAKLTWLGWVRITALLWRIVATLLWLIRIVRRRLPLALIGIIWGLLLNRLLNYHSLLLGWWRLVALAAFLTQEAATKAQKQVAKAVS